jgi:hypothetical protein
MTTANDTPESVCRDALIAQCQRRVDCGMAASLTCFGFVNLCPEYYFSTGSNRTVQGVRACIDAIKQMTCTDIAVSALPDCLTGGMKAAGMGCLYGSQCASTFCDGSSRMCGKCTDVASAGMSCSGGADCAPGSFCGLQSKKCELNSSIVLGAEGAMCNHNASPVQGCQGNLYCSASGICTKMPGEDQPCEGLGGVPCANGGVCVRTSDGGGACRSPDKCNGMSCGAGSYCKYNQTTPTCAPKAGEGQLCMMSGDTGEIPCVDGTMCTPLGTSPSQGVCLKPGSALMVTCSDTMPCPYPLQCTNGKCATIDVTTCGG